jgi:soluble lytic murein transglycosylase-like protein
MHRRLLFMLSFLTAGALSCGNLAVFGPRDQSPVPTETADSETGRRQVDQNIAMTIDYLERRGSGIAKSEIRELAAAIVGESLRYGFDPKLVLAVIHIESRGNAFALSPAGAMGIMQIMPATGEELAWRLSIPWTGPQTLFQPVVNIRMGVAYLSQLEDRFGNLITALAAYNWGPGTIDRRIQRGSALPVRYSGMVLAAYSDREMQQQDIAIPSRYLY